MDAQTSNRRPFDVRLFNIKQSLINASDKFNKIMSENDTEKDFEKPMYLNS